MQIMIFFDLQATKIIPFYDGIGKTLFETRFNVINYFTYMFFLEKHIRC